MTSRTQWISRDKFIHAAGGFLIGYSIIYWRKIFAILDSIPSSVYLGVVGLMLLWTGIKLGIDSTTKDVQRFVYFGGLVGVIVITYYWIVLPHSPMNGGPIEIITSIIFGSVTWFLIILSLSALTMYVLHIDIEKQRRARIDDPYGDKHAARILDEND